ncbi:MAG: 3-isopropylmalate dehydratase large subunit [Armatimonadetes bacterium]|nr:3-isopropylmalate dehydratase large subunit [Armatimonadota bacterium]
MTITEKLLARAAGRDMVRPGDFVNCRVDLVLANDITAPIAIEKLAEMGATRVFDPERVALVADHYTPTKDIKAAQQVKKIRDFAKAQGIKHYYEACEGGIEHIILPEKGLVLPGDVVVGADSHTCTYGALGAFATGVGSTDAAAAMATGECWFRVPETMKFVYTGVLGRWMTGKDLILHTIGLVGVDGARYRAMEFCGPVISSLGMSDRFTMCNMAIEAGGKNGIIEPDEKTVEWIRPRARREYTLLHSDPDAEYAQVHEIDCTELEPVVAFPHLPENTRPLSEVGDVPIDQVVIGACTNGWLEDLRRAAEVLRGRRVAPYVRCIVLPGSYEIFLQATREGLIEVFLEAGCVVGPSTCGPCLGGHMGILAEGERAVATTNRNFIGRMGHTKSEVYLASPYVAAASAVAGRIASPNEL